MWMTITLLALAVGLAADAFAVAVAQGASGRAGLPLALKLGGAFGVAQGLMPLLGWGLGVAFLSVISGIDHWLALFLLGALGTKMIREAMAHEEASETRKRLAGWAILTAAVATSLDAFAAGAALPAMEVPVAVACLTIGGVTALLCAGGVLIGAAAGARAGRPAEVIGGLVLIGLGVKIFVEHQFLGG